MLGARDSEVTSHGLGKGIRGLERARVEKMAFLLELDLTGEEEVMGDLGRGVGTERGLPSIPSCFLLWSSRKMTMQ